MIQTQHTKRARLLKIHLSSLFRDRNSAFQFACKRLIDLVLTTLALLMLSPLMLVIALLIRLDSRGPALFVQQRVGARPRFENGRVCWETCTFKFYKFRSMTYKANDALHRSHIKAFIDGTLDASAGTFKLTNDPRITRIGAFLRRTSLDELPQLWNVMKGDMSLVGPRPVPTYEVEGYQPRHFERLNTMPGITGLWQVKGRSQVAFEDMINLDIEYVRTRSLWVDMKLLFLTVPAALFGRGAK